MDHASMRSTDERHTTNDTPAMISRKELKRDGSTPASIDSSAQDNSSDSGHESSTTTATATTTTVLATTSATKTAEEASHDDAALQPHSRDPLNTDDPKTNPASARTPDTVTTITKSATARELKYYE